MGCILGCFHSSVLFCTRVTYNRRPIEDWTGRQGWKYRCMVSPSSFQCYQRCMKTIDLWCYWPLIQSYSCSLLQMNCTRWGLGAEMVLLLKMCNVGPLSNRCLTFDVRRTGALWRHIVSIVTSQSTSRIRQGHGVKEWQSFPSFNRIMVSNTLVSVAEFYINLENNECSIQ